MNRHNIQPFADRVRTTAINACRKVVAGTALTVAGIGSAMATSTTLSSQFVTEVNAQKAELLVIGGLVLAICGVIFMIKAGKRSAS